MVAWILIQVYIKILIMCINLCPNDITSMTWKVASDYLIPLWRKELTFAVLNEGNGQFELLLYLHAWLQPVLVGDNCLVVPRYI